MENNSIKNFLLMYRYLYKQAKYNRNILRTIFNSNYSSIKTNIDTDLNCSYNLQRDYIEMRKLIKAEKEILLSYNINNDKEKDNKLSKVANYCGLSLTKNKIL